ncbi:Hypothetical predicted protein [Podarcis lilfordi]|uniref:Uncharacterized protein n=1 Tax=Podarcis lilfordi TaxID=74358 RepID=A0AA35KIJ2_9SAUR|nr:Hypothetical predicted protein [Podarcis lilfordi]
MSFIHHGCRSLGLSLSFLAGLAEFSWHNWQDLLMGEMLHTYCFTGNIIGQLGMTAWFFGRKWSILPKYALLFWKLLRYIDILLHCLVWLINAEKNQFFM